MSKKPRVKKGHYLPRFYLAGFTDGGTEKSKLWVFDRKTASVRCQKPISVGYERSFYAAPGNDPDAFEDALSRDEHAIAEVVRRAAAAEGEQPSKDDLATLIYFVALMHIRMPAFRKHYLEQLSQLLTQIGEYSMAAPHAWERHQEAMGELGREGVSRERFERARAAILDGRIRFQAKPFEHLKLMSEHVGSLTKVLLARTWSVVWAPQGSGGFLTSDMPVAVYWNSERRDAPPGGTQFAPVFGSPNAEVFFPLCRWCGVVGRAATNLVTIRDPIIVAHLNTKVINESTRFVFAGDRSFIWAAEQGIADATALEHRMREMIGRW